MAHNEPFDPNQLSIRVTQEPYSIGIKIQLSYRGKVVSEDYISGSDIERAMSRDDDW